MNPEFKSCDVSDIIKVRHLVLRQGKPISTCYFEGDNHEDTFHYAICDQKEVIGCVSFMRSAHNTFPHENPYQLRGMAVLENYQGKNLGQRLLDYALSRLEKNEIRLVWCNVRTSAIQFYLKNHFKIIGSEYNIPEVGPHVLMYKTISNE